MTIIFSAIGTVSSPRTAAEDDYWASVEAQVMLDASKFSAESLQGLEQFSHVEIVFYMHQVRQDKIECVARHPRNNPAWPKVGIFAQRGKNRPNQIGVTVCQLIRVDGLNLVVRGLDAIDKTPVLDIKPYIAEFGPRGALKQPDWASELMKNYFV